jgi:hypothetical protein
MSSSHISKSPLEQLLELEDDELVVELLEELIELEDDMLLEEELVFEEELLEELDDVMLLEELELLDETGSPQYPRTGGSQGSGIGGL